MSSRYLSTGLAARGVASSRPIVWLQGTTVTPPIGGGIQQRWVDHLGGSVRFDGLSSDSDDGK